MRVQSKRLRRRLVELQLDRERRFAAGKAGAVADAEDMRVHREGFGVESDVKNDVGGLAAHAGQRFERRAIVRHLAVILRDQGFRQRDDVLRLGIEQADRLDVLFQAVLTQGHHLFGRLHLGEERARRLVDAGIGRLGGQHHRDQQLEDVARFQLGFGMRVRFRQTAVEFEDVCLFHRPSTSPMR